MAISKAVLLGPPGSGKGTQGIHLSELMGVPLVVLGDILREAVRNGTAAGKEAESYMGKGELVPDIVVVQIAADKLAGLKGFILDGYPRTKAQAEALENITDIDKVFYFDIP
ncbi:MAG: nucleoside monophosphate kinase, partial [bacterium]